MIEGNGAAYNARKYSPYRLLYIKNGQLDFVICSHVRHGYIEHAYLYVDNMVFLTYVINPECE